METSRYFNAHAIEAVSGHVWRGKIFVNVLDSLVHGKSISESYIKKELLVRSSVAPSRRQGQCSSRLKVEEGENCTLLVGAQN